MSVVLWYGHHGFESPSTEQADFRQDRCNRSTFPVKAFKVLAVFFYAVMKMMLRGGS